MKHFMNTTSIVAAVAVAGFVGFASSGAMAASTTGTANATIVSALSVTAGGTPLEFGTIGNAANTVTVDTTGARSATDATQLAGGTPTAADFNVTGNASTAYSISIPATTITDGTTVLTVNNFTHDAGATPTLSAGGADTFNVGADLIVTAGATTGAYTGTFTVTVNY